MPAPRASKVNKAPGKPRLIPNLRREHRWDKDRCAGCGRNTPEWPTGWCFTEEPYAAWCPACKPKVTPLFGTERG